MAAPDQVVIQKDARTAIDGSGTIASGGTAQNLFSGTIPYNGFFVCNLDAAQDLWISDSTTAAASTVGSVRIPPNGGLYETPTYYRPIQAISIVGANSSQKFTARYW